MSVLLAEMTRDQIKSVAPQSVAVLPTASVEQHGPHMPVITDTLLCGTVAQRAAEKVNNVFVAPVFCYGNSHHHRPFAGVLSLSSTTYIAAVTEVLEGLALSGFRKLVVLNGHGGNTDSNAVVGLDFPNRLGHPAAIATAAYWDIARAAIAEKGLLTDSRIPGHAGRFETSMVLALRPDLVSAEALAQTQDLTTADKGIFASMAGATVQVHGKWAASPGYTDSPAEASAEEGEQLLEIAVASVAKFFEAFARSQV